MRTPQAVCLRVNCLLCLRVHNEKLAQVTSLWWTLQEFHIIVMYWCCSWCDESNLVLQTGMIPQIMCVVEESASDHSMQYQHILKRHSDWNQLFEEHVNILIELMLSKIKVFLFRANGLNCIWIIIMIPASLDQA